MVRKIHSILNIKF
jgi:serine/threonine protein kinase